MSNKYLEAWEAGVAIVNANPHGLFPPMSFFAQGVHITLKIITEASRTGDPEKIGKAMADGNQFIAIVEKQMIDNAADPKTEVH